MKFIEDLKFTHIYFITRHNNKKKKNTTLGFEGCTVNVYVYAGLSADNYVKTRIICHFFGHTCMGISKKIRNHVASS